MTRIVCITGTDTDVGKTVVTAALAALAASSGQRVAVIKPVQTGTRAGEPGDLQVVQRLAGIEDVHEYARFSEPLAPATAARRAGVRGPTVNEIAEAVQRLAKNERDLVLVEGAGGLLVELDADSGTLAELAVRLGAPVLVVARAGLGTLNATALTCEALRARRLACLGVVVGSWPAEPDLAAICNLQDLPRYSGAPLLGQLAADAGDLPHEEFLDLARAGVSAALEACLAPTPAMVR